MRLLDELSRDARLAARSLRRARGFTAAVVLTLALGIGANATVFALVDAVVLRPVAGVRDPERLFELADVVACPELRDLAAREPTRLLAGVSERRIALGAGAGAEHTVGALVTGDFFGVAGVGAALGRTLEPRDDVPGAAPVAVVTHDYWRRAFGGDSSIVGRAVTVNGAPVTVVGVAAAGFRGLHLAEPPAVWLPVHAWASIRPSSRRQQAIESRDRDWLRVVGRLPDGATLARAHALLTAAMAADAPDARRADVLARTTPRPAQAAALPRAAREGVVRFAAVLAAAVGLVLLAACANIAGLLLARAAHREREIGVRVAIGAGRARLVRQLLTEALVLAAAGGAAGVALFLDARALLARAELPGGMPGGMPGSAVTLHADARLLAAAVALALLVGTGLFARALSRALAVDLGFRPEHLATIAVDPGLAQMDPARAPAYFAAVAARVAAVPGVRGAAWSAGGLPTNATDRERATIPGYTPAARERTYVEWGMVGPRFHEVMGIALVRGRGLEERDAAGAAPVLVVNETLARRYFPGGDAVGRPVRVPRDDELHRGRRRGALPERHARGGRGDARAALASLPRPARLGERHVPRPARHRLGGARGTAARDGGPRAVARRARRRAAALDRARAPARPRLPRGGDDVRRLARRRGHDAARGDRHGDGHARRPARRGVGVTSGSGLRRWVDRASGELVQQHSPDAAGGRGAWLVRR